MCQDCCNKDDDQILYRENSNRYQKTEFFFYYSNVEGDPHKKTSIIMAHKNWRDLSLVTYFHEHIQVQKSKPSFRL